MLKHYDRSKHYRTKMSKIDNNRESKINKCEEKKRRRQRRKEKVRYQ